MQPINIYVPSVPEQTGQGALIQHELRAEDPHKVSGSSSREPLHSLNDTDFC